MSDLNPLVELTRVRFLRFLREKESIFWVFVFPLLLTMVLGFAFRYRGVPVVKVGVLEGPGAGALCAALERAKNVEVERLRDPQEAERRFRKGALDALIRPSAPLELRFDPARPEGEAARLRLEDALQRAAGRVDPVEIACIEVKETGSRYIDFLLPGILGMNLMGTGIWALGFGLVTDRQRKLLKRLLVTPMRRSAYLFSFVLSRLLFMILEVSLLLVFACWVLGVPMKGSPVTLAMVVLVGTLSFTALGMLLASRVQTIEGISGLVNAAMMPMWLCCGVFFSYERFPEFLHPVIQALPLTALNDALRDVMLDGAGLWGQLPELGVLAAWGVVSYFVALKIFRWA